MRRKPGISCISCLPFPLKEAMAEARASLFLGRTLRFHTLILRVHLTASTPRMSPSLPRPRLPPSRCTSVHSRAGTRALAGDAPVMRFQAGGLENGDGQPASYTLTKDISPLCLGYSCGGSPVLGGPCVCRRSGWDVSEPPVFFFFPFSFFTSLTPALLTRYNSWSYDLPVVQTDFKAVQKVQNTCGFSWAGLLLVETNT